MIRGIWLNSTLVSIFAFYPENSSSISKHRSMKVQWLNGNRDIYKG